MARPGVIRPVSDFGGTDLSRPPKHPHERRPVNGFVRTPIDAVGQRQVSLRLEIQVFRERGGTPPETVGVGGIV
jgi:hypothetical protein